MSLSCVFSIDFSCNEFNIIVEAEDAGDEQEGVFLNTNLTNLTNNLSTEKNSCNSRDSCSSFTSSLLLLLHQGWRQ